MPPSDRLRLKHPVAATTRRILGIDFSGAVDAGRKIWIAEATHDIRAPDQPLKIDLCLPATDLPQSGNDPERAIAALAKHIALDRSTIAGCDFPFGLPASLVDALTWEDFIAQFPLRFPHHESYREDNRLRTQKIEIKRHTDRIAGTPFNSYNLRLYRQAWWGMARLLHPLVTSGQAMVVPQMPVVGLKPIVIEVCAACTLKHLNCYPPYKGREKLHRKARQRILDCLIDLHLLEAPASSLRRQLLDNAGGDALDAVIGAIATARADLAAPVEPPYRLEGRVFFELLKAEPRL
jgi:hypothetical protein